MHLLLLALFSSAGGILVSILASILPHGLVNALVASLVFGYLATSPAEGEA